jgi:carbon monoxide dehydrogenase subunit G
VRVEGERDFDARRDVVWGILNDPSQLVTLMPGAKSFELIDDRHWRVQAKVPLGLGSLAMTIDFERTEERPPEFAGLHAKGRGVGAMLDMQTSFTLEEAGAGTHMLWAADVSIAGPVGSMGQRVLQPIVRQQVDQVLAALEQRVIEATAGDATGSAAAAESS